MSTDSPPWPIDRSPCDSSSLRALLVSMEAILFYGDQDEATRRQVRSVAAQYSHRIGPRKRKKSKLPKQNGHDRKQSHYKKLATTVSDVISGPSTLMRDRHCQTKGSNSHHTPHDGVKAEMVDVVNPDAQHQGQKAQLLRRETSGETNASSSEVGSEPTHSPHTPQLGFAQSTGPPQSPDSPRSAYRRLPAYTWTEYPRYSVNRNGPVSPQSAPTNATAANRIAFELPDPITCSGGLGNCNPGQQIMPRSHPVDMPVRPHHSQNDSVHSDHFLSQLPQRTKAEGHDLLSETTTSSQHSHGPRLQILRCATVDKVASGCDLTRWRDGNEYAASGGLDPSKIPD